MGYLWRAGNSSEKCRILHTNLWGGRQSKYAWLSEGDISNTTWESIKPEVPFNLFIKRDVELLPEYNTGWRISDAFPINSTGVKSHRDDFVFDYDENILHQRISDFKNIGIDDDTIRIKYELPDTRDWKLSLSRKKLNSDPNWSNSFTKSLYRPFDNRYYFTHPDVVELPRLQVMQHMLDGNNIGIVHMRQVALGDEYNHFQVSRHIVDNRLFLSNKGAVSFAPLYLYPTNQAKTNLFDLDSPSDAPGGRKPNLAPEFIEDFAGRLKMEWIPDGKGDRISVFGPEDIFAYMYAVFHSPEYRTRYAEFLKIDFPRLPLTSNPELFRALCVIGDQLVSLHLMDKWGGNLPNYPVDGSNLVESVLYIEPDGKGIDGRVWINKDQYFDGVPPEIWDFHIGGYQVCQKWLKDRKGRKLSYDDLETYRKIVSILGETILLMAQIDQSINTMGGYPIK